MNFMLGFPLQWTCSRGLLSPMDIWNMDFIRSKFGTNEPLASWTLFSLIFDMFAPHTQQTGQKVRKKVFNLSEVNLFWIYSLQNPYSNDWPPRFSDLPPVLSSLNKRHVPGLRKLLWMEICSHRMDHHQLETKTLSLKFSIVLYILCS